MAFARTRFTVGVVALAAVLVVASATPFAPVAAAEVARPAAADPATVTLTGSLQSELGCPGDWQPDCAATHLVSGPGGVWTQTFSLPAGTYDYLVALNGTFDETYGACCAPGGTQITLTVPTARTVRFVYDHRTHLVSDSVDDVIAVWAGDFQSELGCARDFQPDCWATLVGDLDDDGTATLTTTDLPAGEYRGKVALDGSWDVNYGRNGVPGGAEVPFVVPVAGSTVIFSYRESTHVPTVEVRPPLLRVTTSPAVGAAITVDGVARDSWGLTWLPLPPGSHQVCFGKVLGATAPPCQTVSLATAATTSVVGTYVPNGYLRVLTSPALPSTISVDGVPRNDWGVWAEVPVGSHQVCFGAVADRTTPACRTVTVAAGATASTTGTFASDPGSPGPAAGFGYLRAVTAPAVGASISVDGQWRDGWGLNWLKLAPGSHQVCFGALPYATAPPGCSTVSVTAGATTTITGAYALRGSLRVVTSPSVPAVISVQGVASNVFGVWTSKAPGSYQVCFGPVVDRATPPCQTAVVTAGATTTITGTYASA